MKHKKRRSWADNCRLASAQDRWQPQVRPSRKHRPSCSNRALLGSVDIQTRGSASAADGLLRLPGKRRTPFGEARAHSPAEHRRQIILLQRRDMVEPHVDREVAIRFKRIGCVVNLRRSEER
jgi:hypothetical protein